MLLWQHTLLLSLMLLTARMVHAHGIQDVDGELTTAFVMGSGLEMDASSSCIAALPLAAKTAASCRGTGRTKVGTFHC
jgi:hypothetical protein